MITLCSISISAFDQAGVHAATQHFIEQPVKQITVAKTAVSIFGKGRVVGKFIFKAQPAEPAIRQVQMGLRTLSRWPMECFAVDDTGRILSKAEPKQTMASGYQIERVPQFYPTLGWSFPAQFPVGSLVLFEKLRLVLAPLHVRIIFRHRFEMTFSLNLPNKLRVRMHKRTRTITLSTGQTKGLTAIRFMPKFMIHIQRSVF
jgi:hypothetical protein